MTTTLAAEYQIHAPIADWMKNDSELTDETLRERVVELAQKTWQDREARYGAELMRQIERSLMLQFLDHHWREHLGSLDHLRQGIHLRGYAQKNPKQEYKRESFELFSDMLDRIKQDVVKLVLTVQLRSEEDLQAVEEQESVSNVKYQHAGYDEALAAPADDGDLAVATAPPFTRVGEKVGRNDPCPCGSGKKYKHCHGKFASTRARSVRYSPPTPESLLPVPGVALGAAAGKIKNWERNDVLLVVCDPGTVAAGVFTRNRFCAAPVTVCREHLARQSDVPRADRQRG